MAKWLASSASELEQRYTISRGGYNLDGVKREKE